MSHHRSRNHVQVKCHVYRLEPPKEQRLTAILLLLLGLATMSVLAGTQAATRQVPQESVILLQR